MRRPRARVVDTLARVRMVAGFLCLCGASLVARAGYLQLVQNDFLKDEGNQRILQDVEIAASRGTITDRNGEVLALSSPVQSLWANPKVLKAHPEITASLAQALGVPAKMLEEGALKRDKQSFWWLRRHMDPDQAEAFEALRSSLPKDLRAAAFGLQREFRRFYPVGETTAHVVGIADIDNKGQEGLELIYNDWLTGRPGLKRVVRDGRGRQIAELDLIRPAEPGRPLVLSIDRRLQHLANRELHRAVVENQATAGSVVILDVATGEVLALVNQPVYNPNSREGYSGAPRRNRAVTDLLEPGSTLKPFTVAAALETGKITPATVIETWPGTLQVAGHTVRDVRNFGTLTTTSLLTKSSNVATVKLALDMPSEHIYDILQRFGFGKVTGTAFPAEAAGVLPSPRNWGTLGKATISYGYGMSVTPLQLAQAYAALGNGGRLNPPSFIKGAPVQGRDVIDPRIARELLQMMETVTGPEGTARRAAIPGYRVAGKSGTSRKVGAQGYERNYVSLFAGLVPASNPRFAVVVVIDDPRSRDAAGNLVYYGGAVAAPVFQTVMDGALRLMDVPPDDIRQWQVASPRPPRPAPASGGVIPQEAESVPELFEGAP